METFWGQQLEAGQSFSAAVDEQAIHIAQACLVPGAKGPSTLFVRTEASGEQWLPLCTLRAEGPTHCALDHSFFPGDEVVHFKVVGSGAIAVTGMAAGADGEEEDDDDDEEDDDEEEDGAEEVGADDNDDEEDEEEDDDEEEEDGEAVDEESEDDVAQFAKQHKQLRDKAKSVKQQAADESGAAAAEQKTPSGKGAKKEATTPATDKRPATAAKTPEAARPEAKRPRSEPAAAPAAAAAAATTPAKDGKQGGADAAAKSAAPKVRVLAGGVKVVDVKEGPGAVVSAGKFVKVHYTGRLAANDKVFDSSVGAKPFRFRLGAGDVIKGWDVGVKGMRVGGKRRILVPPEMGYGQRGAPPSIPPNSTLVFDVEVLAA